MITSFDSLLPSSSVALYPPPLYPARFCAPQSIELSGVCSRFMGNSYDIKQKMTSPDSTTSENVLKSGMSSADLTSLLPSSKNKRPFKQLPKNSMELAVKYATTESVYTGLVTTSALAYAQYREQCLGQLKSGTTYINKNMRRILTSKTYDPEYLEKRRRNNEAAKKSRESRKAKEDELAIRVSFLEQENLTLKVKLAELEKEKDLFQAMFYYRWNKIRNHVDA